MTIEELKKDAEQDSENRRNQSGAKESDPGADLCADGKHGSNSLIRVQKNKGKAGAPLLIVRL